MVIFYSYVNVYQRVKTLEIPQDSRRFPLRLHGFMTSVHYVAGTFLELWLELWLELGDVVQMRDPRILHYSSNSWCSTQKIT